MSLVYLVLPGAASLVAGTSAWLFGAPPPVILAAYVVTGLVTSVLCVILAGLRGYADYSAGEDRFRLELEMEALRESARADGRFGAGDPDCLAPVLHRSLMRREAAVARLRARELPGRSDFVIDLGAGLR